MAFEIQGATVLSVRRDGVVELPQMPARVQGTSGRIRFMDVGGYVEGWISRAREEQRARTVRAEALLVRARTAAQVLGALGATRVVLFGSLAARRPHAHSDIDLAVGGLEPTALLASLDAAERAAGPGIRVDLVRIEEASPRLLAAFDHGEVLFERK